MLFKFVSQLSVYYSCGEIIITIFFFQLFLVFTQDQIDTIKTAWKTLENSDVLAIDGILDRMQGLETMVYDPDFKFNDEYICEYRILYCFGLSNVIFILIFSYINSYARPTCNQFL